jgi:hypothetical protein
MRRKRKYMERLHGGGMLITDKAIEEEFNKLYLPISEE